MVRLEDIDVIFDNGGGITLQKMRGEKYLHTYNDGEQIAKDIIGLLYGDNPAIDWDGNEIGEYEPVEPSYEDVRNGGYRVYTVDQIRKIAIDEDDEEYRDEYNMPGDSWRNVSDTIKTLRKLLRG